MMIPKSKASGSRNTSPFQRTLLSALLLGGLTAGLSSADALAGGSPRRISGNQDGNCYTPQISPDGSQIAYEVNFFERRVIDLYVYDLTSQAETKIAPKSGSASATLSAFNAQKRQVTYELSWQPGSKKKFIFASSGDNENFDVYLSSGGTLGGADSPAADGMAVWSSDARYVAFSSARSGEGDLYAMDYQASTPGLVQLTNFDDSTEWYPTFSPDGKRLMYVRHFQKGGDNLYVINDLTNAKGSMVPLTNWPSIQTKASWSPDGKMIAFYSNRRAKERYDLYVMEPVANATPRLVLENVLPNERLGPAWTPDGKALLAVQDDAERFNPIRVVNVADPTKVKILATGTQNNGDLSVTKPPSGQAMLAFTAQGRIGDSTKSFKRVYIFTLEPGDYNF